MKIQHNSTLLESYRQKSQPFPSLFHGGHPNVAWHLHHDQRLMPPVMPLCDQHSMQPVMLPPALPPPLRLVLLVLLLHPPAPQVL